METPWSHLGAALRIGADVALYRLRKREANNLVTSISLAWALGLGAGELARRAAFGALLNLFVYLVNDCFDVRIDLQAPGRDNARTRFLAEHLGAAWGLVAALALALHALGALWGGGLLAAAALNTAVIVVYSAVLKHRPGMDLVAMGLWGVSMAMVGFPPTRPEAWLHAGLLGILCMVTEAVQVLRDVPSDRLAGVRSTAVVWGVPATVALARVLLASAASYTAVFLHPLASLGLLPALLVPLGSKRANRAWDALRVLFGLTWLALMLLLRRG
ncbi:MAG: UbiA family prenyltransferase [Deltaproteobacteria bacterium]|nr:UbiA family prenyltransferase [Deltaproteobacteria bacterium]